MARVQSRDGSQLPCSPGGRGRHGVTGAAHRLRTAYRALDGDQRFAAVAAIGLLVAMFLPWYEKNVVVAGSRTFASDSISAFGAVSFVEAAIFLVAAGVIALLLARADDRPFHLPGGDGTVIFVAGLWASALIFYRVFDRPNVSGEGGTVGIQWGFFVAFVAAGALAFAGQRIRVAGRPEPRLPAAEQDAPPPEPDRAASRSRARSRVREDMQTAVVPRSDTQTGTVAPDSAETEIVARDQAQTEVVAHDARPATRDRKVTREDARQLSFDAPDDEPPLRPGEIPRSREGG